MSHRKKGLNGLLPENIPICLRKELTIALFAIPSSTLPKISTITVAGGLLLGRPLQEQLKRKWTILLE
jgi:RNase P/RNase MRP subunit p29